MTRSNWHAMELRDVLAQLGSSLEGLTDADARERRAAVGRNELPSHEDHVAARILARQVRSSLTVLLIVAMLLAFFTGTPLDAAAIGIVLVLNIGIGYATEYRAHRALRTLRDLDAATAVARRDGRESRIAAADLVPGDVVRLEAGIIVPADARVLSSAELSVNESLLTGESDLIAKDSRAWPPGTAMPDRHNMVYSGTLVARGAGMVVATATGQDTELGRIGALMASVPELPAPLERRLERLGRQLTIGAVAATLVVVLALLLRGQPLVGVIQLAIAIGVAAIPEGLPAVATIALAVGSLRMARRNARMRRLSAIESLGAMTAVCVDKTGTLTTGRMTLTAVARPLEARASVNLANDPWTRRIVRAATLATPADPERLDAASLSDPTDAAFVDAARQLDLLPALSAEHAREIAIIPFDSARMFLARIRIERVAGQDSLVAYMKGAASRVLARCTRVATSDSEVALTPDVRRELEQQEAAFARRGLRVLAVASGTVADAEEASLRELRLEGLCGIADPIAPGANEVVTALRGAGIRIVMITGDQERTAHAVAAALGIPAEDVHARVLPEDKLRIVRELQEKGNIVGVLGDGVNDAPALRQADVGIALGARGTDVAKQAAALVLQDDRLETIRSAVGQGRTIFDNIRKSTAYLLSCNVSELLFLLVAALSGLPTLLPLQLLWLNLVTDTFPALALAVEPPDAGVMRRAPRSPATAIVDAPVFARSMMHAALMAAAVLAAAALARRDDATSLRSLVFAVMSLSQVAHLFAARRLSARAGLAMLYDNLWATAAGITSVALTVAVLEVPSLARVLGLAPLSADRWMVATALALIATAVGQLVPRPGIDRIADPPIGTAVTCS
jgi:P-type Ca2+ transporter type 2C